MAAPSDCTWRHGGGGGGAATRAAAEAVSPRGAWAGFSAPLPAQAAVNRARAPGLAGQGRVSEDKALALLITSQDLEPGPKARSGAGRPGRGSQLGGREERPAEPRRHGGDFPPPHPSAVVSPAFSSPPGSWGAAVN